MRIGAGAVFEELVLDDIGAVSVSYLRDGTEPPGWLAEFTVRVAGVADLAVVHRLRAPSLAAARRAVPSAAAFLAGKPVVPEYPVI